MARAKEIDHVIASLATTEKIMIKLTGGESRRAKRRKPGQNVSQKRGTRNPKERQDAPTVIVPPKARD